jgi:adenosine deaminase
VSPAPSGRAPADTAPRVLPPLDQALLRRAPKVLLHDHLDGGLRPQTILELAAEQGYQGLPASDPERLGEWFRRGADQGSLELYLETFEHTVAVMQTRPALIRVAAECAQDLAADGVVYAEVRHAPELSTAGGLSLDEVVDAILEGFRLGAASASGRPIVIRFLATAMRQADRASEIGELALRHRDAGVVGFDIAGPEAGYPPGRFEDVFGRLVHASFHLTLHAGEGYGLPSIREALDLGAERLGHGVRIVDDIHADPAGRPVLGRLAAYVRDRRIPLELCPTSNVHSGAAASIEAHPFDLLRRLRFRVTVNTDNRLMSDVSLSSEFAALEAAFGLGLDEVEWLTLNAMKSAFLPFDERLAMITEVIKPGFATLRAELAAGA